jgi:hypothetical protein
MLATIIIYFPLPSSTMGVRRRCALIWIIMCVYWLSITLPIAINPHFAFPWNIERARMQVTDYTACSNPYERCKVYLRDEDATRTCTYRGSRRALAMETRTSSSSAQAQDNSLQIGTWLNEPLLYVSGTCGKQDVNEQTLQNMFYWITFGLVIGTILMFISAICLVCYLFPYVAAANEEQALQALDSHMCKDVARIVIQYLFHENYERRLQQALDDLT